MDAVVGRGYDRTAAMPACRNRCGFVDVFHQQTAKHSIVGVGITGQDDILLDCKRLAHPDCFTMVHDYWIVEG